jgi:hypothetical protein
MDIHKGDCVTSFEVHDFYVTLATIEGLEGVVVFTTPNTVFALSCDNHIIARQSVNQFFLRVPVGSPGPLDPRSFFRFFAIERDFPSDEG